MNKALDKYQNTLEVLGSLSEEDFKASITVFMQHIANTTQLFINKIPANPALDNLALVRLRMKNVSNYESKILNKEIDLIVERSKILQRKFIEFFLYDKEEFKKFSTYHFEPRDVRDLFKMFWFYMPDVYKEYGNELLLTRLEGSWLD